MHKIYYIMGKSSSGKDSVFKEIRKRMPELRSITLYTTRPIREDEINGREYHFVGETDLQKLEKKDVSSNSGRIRQNVVFGNMLRCRMGRLIWSGLIIW